MTQSPIPQIHQIAGAGAEVFVLRSLVTRNLRIESALPSGFCRNATVYSFDRRRAQLGVFQHGDLEFDDAGGFIAQMSGKVIDLRVKVGDRVSAGDTVLLLEAMKMEHPMRARVDGVVSEVRVTEGEQVEGGALLFVIKPAQEA